MIPPATGQIDGWFKLTEEQREAALEHTRRVWADDDWPSLPEHAQIFAALTLMMVRTIPDRVLDTAACANCRDSGFQSGVEYGVWFCSVCDKGLLLEAGHWRRVRFPEVRGHRMASVSGKRGFEEYAAAHPQRAERVRNAMKEQVQRERDRAETEDQA